MRWMIENINLRCIFYFILFYFVFDTALEKWKSKISFLSPLTLLLKLTVRDVSTRNSTQLLLEYNAFFYKNALTFWIHEYSKLFQFNFPKIYLPNLCIAGRLKLLGDVFF